MNIIIASVVAVFAMFAAVVFSALQKTTSENRKKHYGKKAAVAVWIALVADVVIAATMLESILVAIFVAIQMICAFIMLVIASWRE